MFRPKPIENTLPSITANCINSALTIYFGLKSLIKPTSTCMTKLKNLANRIKDKNAPLSDNEMIEFVGILAFSTGIQFKTAHAIMPLKDKFKNEFWFAISQYQNYDRYIEIEHLRNIYKNPKLAVKLVKEYNAKHEVLEKQANKSVIQNDSKDDAYFTLTPSMPKKSSQGQPEDKPLSEKSAFLPK